MKVIIDTNLWISFLIGHQTQLVRRMLTDLRFDVQFHPEAAIVKHTGRAVNNANAREFMPYDAAIPLFRAFIEVCKNGNSDDND